jgi:hypothetical protein
MGINPAFAHFYPKQSSSVIERLEDGIPHIDEQLINIAEIVHSAL